MKKGQLDFNYIFKWVIGIAVVLIIFLALFKGYQWASGLNLG